jgi:hypothetical protein
VFCIEIVVRFLRMGVVSQIFAPMNKTLRGSFSVIVSELLVLLFLFCIISFKSTRSMRLSVFIQDK